MWKYLPIRVVVAIVLLWAWVGMAHADVTGSLSGVNPLTPLPMALVAMFFTQAIKLALPEKYHRYLPLGLGSVLMAVGAILAFVSGASPLAGAAEGLIGAWGAVWGYESLKGLTRRT